MLLALLALFGVVWRGVDVLCWDSTVDHGENGPPCQIISAFDFKIHDHFNIKLFSPSTHGV